jgi:hypothetical protein
MSTLRPHLNPRDLVVQIDGISLQGGGSLYSSDGNDFVSAVRWDSYLSKAGNSSDSSEPLKGWCFSDAEFQSNSVASVFSWPSWSVQVYIYDQLTLVSYLDHDSVQNFHPNAVRVLILILRELFNFRCAFRLGSISRILQLTAASITNKLQN